MEIKGKIYTPAIIEIVLMGLCVVASLVVLVYEVHQMVKNFFNAKKVAFIGSNEIRAVSKSNNKLKMTDEST